MVFHEKDCSVRKKLGYSFFLVFLFLNFFFSSSALEHLNEHQTASSRILTQAKKILTNLKETEYSHKTVVDEKRGFYGFDCSGLVVFVLKEAAPYALSQVDVDSGHHRARAVNFFDVIRNAPEDRSRNGWLFIRRLIDAEPGDFIVWRYPVISEKGTTGHMVIVLEKPVQEDSDSVNVTVMDAARSGHADDSRPEGSKGVGVGRIRFKVNENGAPVSFYWSKMSKDPKGYPIVIGRVVDIP